MPEADNHGEAAEEYFRHYLNRTIMLLGEEAVQTLRTKTVAIAGCGGHGGAACLTLARMGVGNFILADPKAFDEPDINRQWGASLLTLGRNKAEVYGEILLTINPGIGIKKFCDGVQPDNVNSFLDGADILIDCLDIAVPASLRKQMFSAAREKGLYTFTGAMLGFGGMVAGSHPGGVPLDRLSGIEDVAILTSKLPPGLREPFVPEHMDRLENYLHLHRAPSIAVSPALLGVILSVEAALTLLGNTIPGWRPPLCLPQLLLVDLLRMNFNVTHLDDLILKRTREEEDIPPPEIGASPSSAANLSPEDRYSLLTSAGFNTNLIAHEFVNIDLHTDSWSEIPHGHSSEPEMTGDWATASPCQAIAGLYGYKHVAPVFRGRFAEALLCRALGRPGSSILSNGLFPTTRFHLEANGYSLCELQPDDSFEISNDVPFKGNFDLKRLEECLAEQANIAAVYIELCVNSSGGHPISVANLTTVREITAARGIPILLDATRAFENAVLIRHREHGFSQRSLVSIVRQLCSLSDACACSCTKDFQVRVGGFVAMNDASLFTRVSDLILAFGDGLDAGARLALLRAFAASPESPGGPSGRAAQVALLWQKLRDRGVPVVAPTGGHAVFVDAAALFPQISTGHFPAQALANELFLAGGIRAAPHFDSPQLEERNVHLLRLAVPVGYCSDQALASVGDAFEVVSKKQRIAGLQRVGSPNGMAGEFSAEFRPIASS